MFHRIQQEIGLPARDPANEHLATRDGRYWMRLEWRALGRALKSAGDERRRAVADALLFRARRRQIFPGAAASESALELNEGLAEYTGLRAGGFSPAMARERAIEGLARREQAAAKGSIIRNFAYASGPAYGLLLDAADPSWRQGLKASSDLGDLLADTYGIRPESELAALADRRAVAHRGESLAAAEDLRAREHEAQQAAFRARFVDGPRLLLPVLEDFGYSFDPNAAQVLAGIGTVFANAEVRDTWGRLEVTGGGVLLERPGSAIEGVVVAAPEDPTARPLQGDGWTLFLEKGWRVVPGPRSGDLLVVGP